MVCSPFGSAGPALPAFPATVMFVPVVVFDGFPSEAEGAGAPFEPGSITITPGLPNAGIGIRFAQGESAITD